MDNNKLRKLANLLVNYSIEVKKGEYILIKGTIASLPLLKEIYKEVIIAGGYPEISLNIEGLQKLLYTYGNDEQLGSISPVEQLYSEKYDAQISVIESFNNKDLKDIDPDKIKLRRLKTKTLREGFHKREEEGKFRWCATQYPSQEVADDAGMTLKECEDALFNGGLLDKDDPIEEWKSISRQQERILNYLNNKKVIHVLGKNIDLKMSVNGRKWINCDGKVNFPDGEVFTAPVEDSVEGYIKFSYPIYYDGKEIEDIMLCFEKGKVIKASASKGEDTLLSLISTDEGSCRIGEFAIGTNYGVDKYPKNLFTSEKMGGTIHAALGASLPGTNGCNISSIHMDIITDMIDNGEIYGDGELFYSKGKFLIDFDKELIHE